MATFTITTSAYTNLPPDSVGDNSIEIDHAATHVFTKANFTTETIPQYSDPENDDIAKVKITGKTMVNGDLFLSGVSVSVSDEIDLADIEAGNFTFLDDSANASAHSSSFTFTIADAGSLSFSTSSGTFTVDVLAEANLPPSAVGDRTENISYGETLVFTSAMFTTLTTPAYADPEGDAADQLKITSLPLVGTLRLNGVAVTLNQIIDFTEIAAGNLTYHPDVNTLVPTGGSFGFEIADAGSGEFVA